MPKTSTSLFIKFTVPILILFSGIFFSLGVTYWYAQKNENRRDAILLAGTIMGNLVHLIQLQGMDTEWLQPYIVRLGSGPGILEICVCNPEGEVQVGTLSAMEGHSCYVALTGETHKTQSAKLIDLYSLNEDVLHLSQKIPSIHPDDPPLGSISIEIDIRDKFLVTLWENQKVLASLILSLLFLVVSIYFFIHYTMVKRMQILQAAALSIAEGDFTVQLPSNSSDEFDSLADTFNFMADTLNNTVVSMNHFNSVIRSVGDILLVFDQDGIVKLVNTTGLEMLGYDEEEIHSCHIRNLLSDPEKIWSTAAEGDKQAQQSRTGVELELVTKDGASVPVLFSLTRIIDKNNTLSGYVCVAQDIRQQKEEEKIIQDMNNHLKGINLKLQETQAQLVQSAKLASLGEMATGITHELNQPLVVINLNAHMAIKLLELGKSSAVVDNITTILDQVKRAGIITDHLKTFGRNPDTIDMTSEDLNEIVKDSFILFNEQLRLRAIEVSLNLAENLPLCSCNKIQVEQVITNLLSNARDELEASTVKIITVRTYTDNGNLIIEIADSGQGISGDIRDKIFDPFFTTKEIGKGTGLGLAISYGIMEQHNGSLEFESEPGKGTIFRMKLPVDEDL